MRFYSQIVTVLLSLVFSYPAWGQIDEVSGDLISKEYSSYGNFYTIGDTTVLSGEEVSVNSFGRTFLNPGFHVEIGGTLRVYNNFLEGEHVTSWLQKHFGTTDVDLSKDSDNDGLTNIQEYKFGTNPNKADSRYVTSPWTDTREISGDLPNGTIEIQGHVQSIGTTTVETGSDVTLSVLGVTRLNPGFKIKAGGSLKVEPLNDNELDEYISEYFTFGNVDWQDDPDQDGLTNMMEFRIGTNPHLADNEIVDANHDGWADLISHNFQESTLPYNPSGSASLSSTSVVGSSGGSFASDNNGLGAWSLSLSMPPGVGGLTPNLSIQLSTSGGNGPLGQRAQIGGLSSISRCTKNLAQDGVNRPIQKSSQDGFCLNGNRLILVAGEYGEDGSEYRTEVESFVQIFARDTVTDTGPLYFEVFHGNGTTTTYGQDDAAITDLSTGAVLEWKIKKQTDVNGNNIDYVYSEKGGQNGRELLLHSVQYGGNQDAGISNYIWAYFEYEDRSDITSSYSFGSLFGLSKRLYSIKINHAGQNTRSYQIGYESSEVSKQSRINQIVECGGDGSCYAPTLFSYTPEQAGWQVISEIAAIPDSLRTAGGLPRGVLADVNNDGRTDWVISVVENDGTEVLDTWLGDPNTPGGWRRDSSWQVPAFLFDYEVNVEGIAPAQFTDVNGDGWVDIIEAFSTDTAVVKNVWLNTGSGWDLDETIQLPDVFLAYIGNSQGEGRLLLADINSDGRDDLIVSTKSHGGLETRKAWLNNGNGWEHSVNWTPPMLHADYSVDTKGIMLSTLMDVNSDGLIDWVQSTSTPTSNGNSVWLNSGNGWQASSSYSLPVPLMSCVTEAYIDCLAEGTVVDLNSDGLPDIVQAVTYSDNSSISNAWVNTGTEWIQDASWDLPASIIRHNTSNITEKLGALMDLDGDGSAEFVQSYVATDGGEFYREFSKKNGHGWQENSGSYAIGVPLPLFLHLAGKDSVSFLDTGDLNGDGIADLFVSQESEAVEAYTKTTIENGQVAGLLTTIVNELGLETEIRYGVTTDSGLYTPVTILGSKYPTIADNSPKLLVQSVAIGDGMGGINRIYHQYGESRVNLQGRGGLGFSWHNMLDPKSNILVQTALRQDFPFTGKTEVTTRELYDDIEDLGNHTGVALYGESLILGQSLATHNSKTLNNSATVFTYTDTTENLTYELDGRLISKTDKQYFYEDDFGNITKQVESISTPDGSETYTTVKEVTYSNNVNGLWISGLPIETSITVTNSTGDSHTRFLVNEYDLSGRLIKETLEPGYEGSLTSFHSYDIFGNRVQTTIRSAEYIDRVINTEYSSDGRFPLATTNQLGHRAEMEYDGRFGVVTKVTGPNGKVKISYYDSFGTKVTDDEFGPETDYVGQTTSTLRFWCEGNSQCPENAVFFVASLNNQNQAPMAGYYDANGREIRSVNYGLSGRVIYKDTLYDSFGRKSQISKPYFSDDETQTWARLEYDILDRVVSQTGNDGVTTTIEYDGLTKTTTKNGQTVVFESNVLGKTVVSTDPQFNSISYTYDARSNLKTTTDVSGNTIELWYDHFGRKIKSDDPDMGIWEYSYDSFGNLISQTDAKGQTTIMEMDALSRLVKRVSHREDGTPDVTTEWEYDTAPEYGIGRLAEVFDNNGYSRVHQYDEMGRIEKTITTINDQEYITQTRYVGLSNQVDTIIYPSGQSVRNKYDEWGNHTNIVENDPGPYQDYTEAAELANRLTAEVEAIELETAAERQSLTATYNAKMGLVESELGNIDDTWTSYNNYIDLAGQAATKVNYYNTKISQSIAAYNKYKAEYDDEVDDYKSHTAWSKRYSYRSKSDLASSKHFASIGDEARSVAYAQNSLKYAKKAAQYADYANRDAKEMKVWAGKCNSAANTTNSYATLRDQWQANLTHYNSKVIEYGGSWEEKEESLCYTTYNKANGLCLVERGLYQEQNSNLEQNPDYVAAITARDRLNSIVSDLNDKYEQTDAAIATANQLYTIYESSEQSARTHWEVEELTASGQLSRAKYGNGVNAIWEYDSSDRPTHMAAVPENAAAEDMVIQDHYFEYDNSGNLTRREDVQFDLVENFQYDNLNRLIGSSLEGTGATLYEQIGLAASTFSYDRLGNLTYKSDVGNYFYGSSNGGPHAVSSITNGNSTSSFVYDANGNMTQGRGKTIVYNTYNKPTFISKSGSIYTAMEYGPEDQLVYRSDINNGLVRTTYVNPVYEEVLHNTGLVEKRHNLKAFGMTVAVLRSEGDTPVSPHYLHRDHLESIVTITDESGLVVDRRHYDAFGKERRGVVKPGTPEVIAPLIYGYTGHGFTGHKQLESLGLVHMGGRVYDPEIGRFLSADPFIQFALNSQSYNRYSYVLNNPLSFNDPSGYFLSGIKKVFKGIGKAIGAVFKAIGKIVKAVVKFVQKYWKEIAAVVVVCVAPYAIGALAVAMPSLGALGGALYGGVSATGALVAGAVGGAAAGLITTGSLKGALIGAASGAAFAGIGNMFATGGRFANVGSNVLGKGASETAKGIATGAVKTVAHGVVGGVRSAVSGGKFAAGFLSAGFTAAFAPVSNFAHKVEGFVARMAEATTAGLIGGTGSVIGGGTFKDGFRTGVFSRGFNDLLHTMKSGLNKFGDHIERGLDKFGENFRNNIRVTNDVIFGYRMNSLIGFGTGRYVASNLGSRTGMQLLIHAAETGTLQTSTLSATGAVLSTAVTTVINVALVVGSLEAGIFAGSFVNAGFQTVFQ